MDGFDSGVTLQDRVRLYLGEHIQDNRYVPVTTDKIASDLRVQPYNVYQTLARLQRLNEIEFDKDGNKIIGIKVHKLEQSGRTYQRAAERAKIAISGEDYEGRMINLLTYSKQKLTVLRMHETAKQAGLDPQDTVKFEENPYAEEGLLLLDVIKGLNDKINELKNIEYDLEAARRDNEFLKRQRGQLVGSTS